MTDVSLIQARDDGHLAETAAPGEAKERLLQLAKGKVNPAVNGKDRASSHRFVRFSSQHRGPRAPQLCLTLPQPCSEQECCGYEAGRVWCLDLAVRVTKTWCVLFHGCKQQSGERGFVDAAPQATSLIRREGSRLIAWFLASFLKCADVRTPQLWVL